MRKTSILVGAAALALFATAAFAQDTDDPFDPSLYQNGINCAGTYWCASDGQATDLNTNLTTLEFVMNTMDTAPPGTVGIGVPWATGWVEDVGPGGTVEELLDFTSAGTGSAEQDILYLYSISDQCSSLDNFSQNSSFASQIQVSATFNLGSQYKPTSSSQPGYANALITTPSGGKSTGYPTYAIQDVATPEPSAVLLLSVMLIGLGVFAARKISAS